MCVERENGWGAHIIIGDTPRSCRHQWSLWSDFWKIVSLETHLCSRISLATIVFWVLQALTSLSGLGKPTPAHGSYAVCPCSATLRRRGYLNVVSKCAPPWTCHTFSNRSRVSLYMLFLPRRLTTNSTSYMGSPAAPSYNILMVIDIS